MSLQVSINNSKNIHIWTLLLKAMLILMKFPFQQYKSCWQLNFDPTCDNGCHGALPLQNREVWGSLTILWFAPHFFLNSQGHKNVKREICLDSKMFTGIYSRDWTMYVKQKKSLLFYSKYPQKDNTKM